MKFLAPVALSMLTLATASQASNISSDVIVRGWQPQVDLIGSGDATAAVSNLRSIADLQQTVLQNTQFHEQTQQFIDELWASLESFNLDRYYNLLPEADGEWHRIGSAHHGRSH